MNPDTPRFLGLHLLRQFGEDLFRFRWLRYRGVKPDPTDDGSWYPLGQAETIVRDRPELGEQNANRINNMKLACVLLDGTRLPPQALFSMKRSVGRPSPSRGFSVGPAFVHGRLVPSCGGGLCQVSTTLFLASLRAGLTIVERYNHSIDLWGELRLVPLGLDAAYAYAVKDLKVANPYFETIRCRIRLIDRPTRLECVFESKGAISPQVKIENRVLRTHSPGQAPIGFRPVFGYDVETVRSVKRQLAWDEDYHTTSHYRPVFVPTAGRKDSDDR
jgi:vancomycin resistance protein YoaR